MLEPVRISKEEISQEDDRFQRFRLISWWNQKLLANARVLVVGAGALGNEIIKNLAMLGVGNILIADLDTVENSNLSRSVLFREADNGKPKAEVAAAAARSIFPDINVRAFHGDVVHDLGLGVFRWADIVLGGLDNREARLAINRNCWKVNRPWIDGAIEQIQGIVRFFAPDGPCYECTMSERDWKILQQRRSCNLLTKEEMQEGRTPTTPTISSIIAGVQCQEAVKHLHGLSTMRGRGWVFEGLSGDSYSVEYQKKGECYSHDVLDEVISLNSCASSLTGRELLQKARALLGEKVEIQLAREMIERLVCPACGTSENVFKSVSQVKSSIVMCPMCSGARREVVTYFRINGSEPFLDLPLSAIGIPPFDIIFATTDDRRLGFELTGDASSVLGNLFANEDAVEWT